MPAKERHNENPAHIPVKRVFTDREEPRKAFRDVYEKAVRHPEDYNVIHYYGRGGIGKSCLLAFLYEEIRKEKGYAVFYDMEEGTEMRRILARLRNKLVQEFPKKFSFDLFDLALLKYSELAGEKNELVEKEDETIIESNSVLSAILDGIALIPGISIVSTVIEELTKGYHHIKDISEDYRKLLAKKAAGLKDLKLNELLDKLPEFFSDDLAKACKKLDKPLVIFLDTYEQLVNYMSDVGIAGNEDRWLRDTIIQYTPNSVWVIAGRDRLRWREIDKNWKEDPDYSDHVLGHLAKVDSVRYLATAGIDDDELCQQIYELTGGDPLYLDLSVSTWQDLKMAGKTPSIEAFGDKHELVKRYLRYMDSAHRDMVEILACFGKWTDEEAKEKIPRIAGSFSRNIYETITGSTLVQNDSGGGYYLHRVVREAILGLLSREEMQEISGKLAELNSATEKPFSLEYVAALDTEVDQLIKGLKKQIRVSAKSIEQKTKKLRKQGNEREILRALMPLYRYEESVDFKDVSVFYLLSDFLSAHVLGDDIPLYLDRVRKVYDAYVRNGVSGKTMEGMTQSMLYAYMNNAHYEEALKIADEERSKYETSGKKGYYYSNLLSLIGSVYTRQKRYSEGAEVLEEALELQRQEVVENKRTPESITNAMKNLAFCYRALKKPEKALQLDRELQKAYVETYGEDHILSLSAEGDIASDLLALGRQDEAETLLRQSLQTYQNKHGESHTYTLAAMSKLARVLTFGKKYEEALELYRREYELRKAKSGDAHPETCLALHNLADAYWRMGDRPRAYALNEEALKHMHDGCGINDPRSRPILYSLRGAYNAPGEYEKGEAVCREGLEILKKNPHLEKQNPDNRQMFLEWLCFYLSKQGRLKEAEETAIALGTNNE